MWKPLLRDTDKMKWLDLILLINHDKSGTKSMKWISWAMMTKSPSHPILHGELILQAELIG